jgi:hypothetical protein
MNYDYIFWPRTLFDFSDGSRDPVYDFDDWGHYNLACFQNDDASIEEPIDENFDDKEVVNKNPEPVYKDRVYVENLTLEYLDEISHYDLVKNTDCDLRIYVKTEDQDLDSDIIDIRVYVKPQVDPVVALWALAAEGKLNQKEGRLEFYSYEELYEEALLIN